MGKRIVGFLLVLIAIVLVGGFFAYRILVVPPGLTVDEAAFGYNAALLSKTGHDENGRFLPIFVLSIDGKDWRQPVPQYFMAGWFKIFGPSVWGFRFTSVVVTLVSAVLLFWLAYLFWEKLWLSSLVTGVFLTTPLLMIQSHMGLDNIYVIPFTLGWLLGIYKYQIGRSEKYAWVWLVFSGVSLGLGFYSYKGMRATVPVWVMLSFIYLLIYWFINKLEKKLLFRSWLIFGGTVFPFFAIIPWLEKRYSGAILGGSDPKVSSVYEFFYGYLSSFDWTFLFITGDELLFHSTEVHGMFLLSSLPLFLLGSYDVIRKKDIFGKFVLGAFLSAPLLYGLVGSVHRASRLMVFIPLFALICGYGIRWISRWRWRFWKWGFSILITILMLVNYVDFVNYYWFTYPKYIGNILMHLQVYKAYDRLAQEVAVRGEKPYIIGQRVSELSEKFYEQVYFDKPIFEVRDDQVPVNGLALSRREEVPGMERISEKLGGEYYVHVGK